MSQSFRYQKQSSSSLMASSHVLIPPPPSSSSLSKAFHLPTLTKIKKATPINKTKLQELLHSLEMESNPNPSQEIRPINDLYNTLISICIRTKDITSAGVLRSHLKRTDHEPDIFLTNQFINLYSKCGQTDAARAIFDGARNKNPVTWNAMMSGYCSDGRSTDSLLLFRTMIESGFTPDRVTYLTALRAASGSRCFSHGEQLHSSVVKNGCHRLLEVGNALISMYSKFDRPEEAEIVGDTMAERDEITWNSLIASRAKHDSHDQAVMTSLVEMMRAGLHPDEFTFGSLLSSSSSKDSSVSVVKELHSQTVKRGLVRNVVVGSSLVDAYARSENPRDALLVFHSMPERNIVTWNSAIAACFGNDDMVDQGLELFLRMGESGFVADEYTMAALLKVASSTGTGKQLHGLVVKTGRHTDTWTCNGLISMYAKLESVSDSCKIFDSISEPDLVSWNSMARAFLANEEFGKSITVFVDMKRSGFRPDEYSFASALTACASSSVGRYRRTGKEIHGDLLKTGMVGDAFLGAVLVDMYSKCKEITEAIKVFDGIEEEKKDLIIWNSIVSGLSQNGNLDQVLNFLCLMKEQENLEPDSFTFASVLSACAKTTTVPQGRQVHAMILKSENLDVDAAVTNALITMYGRAGCVEEAEAAFSRMPDKNVVSWTSMIGGYAYGGYSEEAFATFDVMERSGTVPNGKTFVALLTACSYGGTSESGYKYFEVMRGRYGIEPGFDHYACMVDILSRAGKLEEAEDLIEGMPFEPDAVVWKMVLSGCRIRGDRERGKRAMEKVVDLERNDSAAYVLLSNLYADLGDWDGVLEVRRLMRENGVRKEVGKSWIQVREGVHEFTAGDLSHPRRDEMCSTVNYLLRHMKDG